MTGIIAGLIPIFAVIGAIVCIGSLGLLCLIMYGMWRAAYKLFLR